MRLRSGIGGHHRQNGQKGFQGRLHGLRVTITLQPGDIISTGTPPGVGMGKKPQVWLQPGDVVEATVEGIGTLRSTFVSEE